MAPLTFRLWDPTVERMAVDVTLEFLAEQKDLVIPDLNVALARAAKSGLVFMQSTGLLDKNGREIFEGDVVRCEKWDGEYHHDEYAFVSDVAERSGVLAAKNRDGIGDGDADEMAVGYMASWEYKLEVIGNIYENPDFFPKAA